MSTKKINTDKINEHAVVFKAFENFMVELSKNKTPLDAFAKILTKKVSTKIVYEQMGEIFKALYPSLVIKYLSSAKEFYDFVKVRNLIDVEQIESTQAFDKFKQKLILENPNMQSKSFKDIIFIIRNGFEHLDFENLLVDYEDLSFLQFVERYRIVIGVPNESDLRLSIEDIRILIDIINSNTNTEQKHFKFSNKNGDMELDFKDHDTKTRIDNFVKDMKYQEFIDGTYINREMDEHEKECLKDSFEYYAKQGCENSNAACFQIVNKNLEIFYNLSCLLTLLKSIYINPTSTYSEIKESFQKQKSNLENADLYNFSVIKILENIMTIDLEFYLSLLVQENLDKTLVFDNGFEFMNNYPIRRMRNSLVHNRFLFSGKKYYFYDKRKKEDKTFIGKFNVDDLYQVKEYIMCYLYNYYKNLNRANLT